MPMITGINNVLQKLNHVKLGTKEISKAYLGTQLVYNGIPVWLFKLSSGTNYNNNFYSSLDGTTYTDTSTSWNYAFGIGKTKTKLLFIEQNSSPYIRAYDINNLKIGKLSYTNWNVGFPSAVTGVWKGATNGKKIIAVLPNNDNYANYIYYSTDDGATWKSTTANISSNDSARDIKYIGDDKFWINKSYYYDFSDGAEDQGKYFVWSPSGGVVYRLYYLPDNTLATGSNRNGWCKGIDVCTNGRVYMYVNSNVYYGNYTQATGKVATGGLKNFVYCYGKYYAIYTSDSNRRKIAVSNDGITFTATDDLLPSTINSTTTYIRGLLVANNKLYIYGNNFVGLINSNNAITYQGFSNTSSSGTSSLLCSHTPDF